MRKLALVTPRAMLVDTNTMLGDDNTPLWRMSTSSVAFEVNLKGSSTYLWRDRAYCQMKPNAAAVRRLLKVLGFDDVRRVRPKTENLPPAYHEGRRRTFIVARTSPCSGQAHRTATSDRRFEGLLLYCHGRVADEERA